ncbi:MAG TPA: methyl-accepting chemotaxis protein [Actinomycetes bacterium]|nr:methyl-accepting chemotaxis protein [Actinomycetes bacterium]
MSAPTVTPEAGDGLDKVEKVRLELENGDLYSKHNGIETILVHWGVALLGIVTLWLINGSLATVLDDSAAVAWLSVVALNSLLMTGLAVYSYRSRMPMEYTDWWDGIGGLVLATALVGLTTTTGGYQSPLWFLVVGAAVYTAAVFVYVRGFVALGLLVVLIVVSGRFADDWQRADVPYAVAIIGSIVLAFLLVKELGRVMYDLIWETGQKQISLLRSVRDLRVALAKAASGDLTTTIEQHDEMEETQELRESLNQTVLSLRSLVEQIRQSGADIATASTSVVGAAQQSAAGAAQQSGTVAQTTATIEELASTAAQIAETAGSVARVAQETMSLTTDGRGAVAESVDAMEQIRQVVGEIGQSSSGLGEKLTQVGQIVAVIDELSEQTNLLALNAAIEAARAGEHGRGFAVVAAEVRKLAERAQQSTSEIQQIVAEIENHTRLTIASSEEGARAVDRGADKAAGVAAALDRIASMVDETTGAAEEISIATQQQRSASEQVVGAMNQVSEVSRQASAGAEAGVEAAAQLDALAAGLGATISRFRTDAQP